MDINSVWDEALSYIYNNIDNEAGYNGYIRKLIPDSYDENNSVFALSVQLTLEKSIIELRYKSLITDAVSAALGKHTDIKIFLNSSKNTAAAKPAKKTAPAPAVSKNKTINPKFTFDNFVVGGANEFAYTASKKVAELPGTEHNPLFLYGSSGVGKTHLMHAIGNHTLLLYPDMNIIYVTSEKFLNDFIACVRDKSMDEFRHTYRDVDLLMIDDIQFFENKEGIQEEFFHTFNELHNRQNQIVLTSDRLPQDLVTLEDRLKTRFISGLTIDISMVDYETRIAILQKKAENNYIPDEVYAYIADRIKSNIRELEGALSMVISFSKMHKKPITIELAKEALINMKLSDNIIKVTPSKVLEQVSNYYSIPIDRIKGKERTKKIAYARQVAQYMCFHLAGMTYKSIGDEISKCDHTTVMSNVKKIQGMIDENKENTKNEIDQITKNIYTPV
ncbi:MAG: chromosomal replication initiator protein DnaA [Oscillospiraceae bacterium]|nr:chromosomal replication initiator protein DnaA [Oscillospiraceae bacterium]